LLLALASLVVRSTCGLLIRAASHARRRNYELLAFHAFGFAGKLAVELCMAAFLMGTCVAFFVVMGDLAPPIVAEMTGVEAHHNLRIVILVGTLVAV
jgi:sodium-coupled neutral amino acid transporter 10